MCHKRPLTDVLIGPAKASSLPAWRLLLWGVPLRTSRWTRVKTFWQRGPKEVAMVVQTPLFGICFVQQSVSISGLSWLREDGWVSAFLRRLVG